MMNSIEMNMFVMIERIYSDRYLINYKGHLLQEMLRRNIDAT